MSTLKDLRVNYAQAVHGKEEELRVLRVLREHRTILGKETTEFEKRVAQKFGKKFGIMVNSGSSAITIAIELIDLPPGSEIITPLLTFSTTIAPILRAKLIPVFTDVEIGKYTIDISQIENLITKKTKALMIPLLLGNVPDMRLLAKIAKKNNLLFIEDSCDTLGPAINNRPAGLFSDISVTSFYGSHIITAGGGGGMIMVNRKDWKDKAQMLRGWGRSSSRLGESEDLDKRFGQKIDGISYDAKFIFDEIGYNFLPVEMGSAFGNAQLDKLDQFQAIRKHNFQELYNFFQKFEDFFVLPQQNSDTETQWLAFPLTIKESSPFSRLQIVKSLEANNIQTRPVFTGNILKQPGFRSILCKTIKTGYPVTEKIMKQGFLIGCHHGLTQKHLQKIKTTFTTFLRKYTSR